LCAKISPTTPSQVMMRHSKAQTLADAAGN
jgi:hypothetical protein